MSNDFAQRMGRRILDARLRMGGTQTSLAKALGYKSSVSVMRWENGVSPVPVYQLAAVSAALGVSVLHLLGMDDGDPYGAPAVMADTIGQSDDARVLELEEACEIHLATIGELKEDNTAALAGIKSLKDERVELHEENVRLTQQLASVQTGQCYDSKCILRAGHEGLHYDGTRRYYAAER